MKWYKITYPFRRKYQQIKRIIDFFPIIWNGFDFDYSYSVQLFKKSLERQAKFLESGNSYSSRSKQDALRIRTAIRLMDKVYNEEYEMEWMDKVKEQYGSDILDWEFEDTGRGDGTSYLKYKYEDWNRTSEVKKQLAKESREKQKRAHKLLWDFIEHNIQHWWD
jgi:hypothetical protein